jgi:thiol-disulfide isomerase/thioredoxin
MKIFKLLLLPIFLLLSTNVFSQKIGDGVVLAHFNAGWNSANEVKWLGDVDECNIVKVDITTNPKIPAKHKIVVVPTLILFKDGEEVKRWQAGIDFKIAESKDDIQEEVHEQNLSDF